MSLKHHLILASGSPRRHELLAAIVPAFQVIPSKVDEDALLNIHAGSLPQVIVQELALAKAKDVAALHPDGIVIGADTVVVVDNDILGKPQDQADAYAMLSRLSGRTHEVFTGIAVIYKDRIESDAQSTLVTFRALSIQEITDYIATGEPMDKAGAYGIQNRGSSPVASIVGDYYNVMGLPLEAIGKMLMPYLNGSLSLPEQPSL